MKLDVPYQSQEPLENGKVRKWCGIATVWMIMAYYLQDQAPTVEELLKEYGESFEQVGFQHQDLLKIVRQYGLSGFRKSWWAYPGVNTLMEKFAQEGESQDEIDAWMETNIEESLFTIEKFILKGIPIIVSVSEQFSPSQSTHLVVVVGVEADNLIIHDPYKKGPSYQLSKDAFKKYWIRQAIIILPRES